MSIFNSNYNKGIFNPSNKEKCLNCKGNGKEITYRSKWEKIFMSWCDREENILEWGSEIYQIPYYSQLDGKTHRYISDFVMTCKTKDGNTEKWLIEVKPKSQVPRLDEGGNIIYPKPPKRKTEKQMQNWTEMCNTLKKNDEKWKSAKEWCYKYGYKFKVVTEVELGIIY